MHKIFKKFGIVSGLCHRQLCTKPDKSHTPRYVDLKTKTVYGGDLPISTSRQSVGQILYSRMIQPQRRNNIFQVNSSTDVSMTTKNFVRNAVALAERLEQEGVKKGDYVVLLGNNSLNMNVALVGLIFMGVVPLPLTHNTHLDEFKAIVMLLKPKYFACDRKYLYSCKKALVESKSFNISNIFLLSNKRDVNDSYVEGFGEFIQGKGQNYQKYKPPEVNDPEKEYALLMKALTDGSYGRVAGLTHHNINSVIARYDSREHDDRTQDKVILMVQKVMWMSGIYSLLLSCLYGSKLIVMPDFKEENFFRVVHDYKVTSTFLYSSKCWQLYKHVPEREYDLSSLKDMYAVDGSLPHFLIDELKRKIGASPKSCYGVTELSGLVLEPTDAITKQGSTGKIIPQTYGRVISDKTLKYAGPNEKGELCFKGPTLVSGYVKNDIWRRTLLDREGFLLSGHYGYYDEDGEFFIIDRIIHQIKYKDYKISPRELEAIIKSLPSVKDVCVSGITHPTDGQYPIAFVSLIKGQKITEREILDFVNEKVPDYKKIRGGVIFLPKIPRLRENGSLNRNIFKKVLAKYQLKRVASTDDNENSNTTNPKIIDNVKKPS